VDVIVPRISDSRMDALRSSLENIHDLVVFALEVGPYLPASPPPGDPDREAQGYLEPRGWGVGAGCAWQVEEGGSRTVFM
jgi:hypothetical protein